MNIKKIVILTIIFLLCILSIFVVIAITNYFYIKKQELIQFADLKECEREWLQTQRPLQRHDIYVMSEDEIPEYMKNFNIEIDIRCRRPGYNAYNANWIWWHLKEPEPGLLHVYFKSRPNPFKAIYPATDNEYTLNDLLKYELSISDAYVFWDANIKDDLNTTICHHKIEIYNHQNNDTYKKESIQKDLFDNNITNNKIRVNLNCYNLTSTAGLSALFNSNKSNFYGYKIEAVYFDDGYRLEYPDISINNLIRLGNGAKTIYLYSFNVLSKKEENIVLPTSSEPYDSIQLWKIEKIDFDTTKESPFKWKVEANNFTLTQTVETENTIYHISCDSDYKERLERWKNQCYFKPGNVFDSAQIMSKVSDNGTFYSDSNSTIYAYMYNTYIYPHKGICYYYFNTNYTNFPYYTIKISGDNTTEDLVARWRDWRFDGYFDTTPPPSQPDYIKEYDKSRKLIKSTTAYTNKFIAQFRNEYNENEKIIKQETYIGEDQTLFHINEYNENEKLIKTTEYHPKTGTIYFINEFNNNKKTKLTFYYDDQNIDFINEYDENEKKIKQTIYYRDSKTIDYINEYNKRGKLAKQTIYYHDSKAIDYINEYNLDGIKIKTTHYNPDGSIKK
jgi:hypothetical protein